MATNEHYSTVTTESWGGRLMESLKGMLFGGLLFIAAFPLLFWNEGRAVDRAKALEHGAAVVVSVGSQAVDPANEGKLVHAGGLADTTETLSDADFGIDERAIRLRRKVEMFQWIEESRSETKEKLGGGTETVTTYTYKQDWSDEFRDSTAFKVPDGHRNPDTMAYGSAEYQAGDVRLGAFRLNPDQVARIGQGQLLALSGHAFPGKLADKPVIRQNDILFLGKDPSAPRVGDLRVSFEVVKPTRISVVARQKGDSFEPYETETGSVMLQAQGDVPAQAMFKSAEEDNVVLTWILRGAGFLIMFLGIRTVLAPLRTLAAVVPFIANIVGIGLGLVAFVVALSLSLIVIAIAWLAARPVLGVALLVVGVGVPLLLKFVRGRKTVAMGAAVPAAD